MSAIEIDNVKYVFAFASLKTPSSLLKRVDEDDSFRSLRFRARLNGGCNL